MGLESLESILIYIVPLLFAITLHEAAHGWAASKLGDRTAVFLGRVSLNPISHIDLVGTIIIPLLTLLVGGVVFGWAKPVPINSNNFKNPRRDMAWVALMGPLANLLMAIFWMAIVKMGAELYQSGFAKALGIVYVGKAGVSINLFLMLLNLIPLPPLDGSRIVSGLLPPRSAYEFARIEPYGFWILLILLMTNILNFILVPPYHFLLSILTSLFGLN